MMRALVVRTVACHVRCHALSRRISELYAYFGQYQDLLWESHLWSTAAFPYQRHASHIINDRFDDYLR